ncbi:MULTISPECIES: shikimate kinase [unclassified Bacillus (in: firmicutes)]|uniref:shikimate kinase n=1 Tax=unclassified Bacillus (in: firmicutes) TaxID=185979 RepID=UPI0008EF3B0D|nr:MULTISPECIES: shikimate kinase [unclassified Bacillus (in: firmicutes)]SFA96439.1 shikimate kinase [Bacillus sp. UNCCL13]SFQ79782.1 shikimate kinase [Bacillus sp. cl95]
MKTIFLIGFMGSGKTTVGKLLSKKMKIPVCDTDQEIVREKGTSITNIFETIGEEGFRLLETKKLKEMPLRDYIVTTGGGVILRQENREWMIENGTVVFLDTEPDEILNRLKADTTRPLLQGDMEERIQKLWTLRQHLYLETGHIRIHTTGKLLEAIVEEIKERLEIH